jgi:CheY-like chemotaxis protein
MRILIVEDEPEVARLLAEAVEAAGHEARAVEDGRAALDALGQARGRPEAVFLDVAMPGMGGLEVLRRLRARDRELPVVIVTGHAHQDEVAEARRLGISGVVRKPDVLVYLAGALAALGGGRA